MIVEILEVLFILLTTLMIVYLIRHYIFTLTVLQYAHKRKKVAIAKNVVYQPSVSVLIPARDEELVIGRILKRMTELTYPTEKMQVIAIDDASKDRTGRIMEEFAEKYDYIKVMH